MTSRSLWNNYGDKIDDVHDDDDDDDDDDASEGTGFSKNYYWSFIKKNPSTLTQRLYFKKYIVWR